MKEPVKRPRFSVEQILLLESMFPEQIGSGQSFSELQYRAGQRSVLDYIKQAAMVEVRYVQRQVLP